MSSKWSWTVYLFNKQNTVNTWIIRKSLNEWQREIWTSPLNNIFHGWLLFGCQLALVPHADSHWSPTGRISPLSCSSAWNNKYANGTAQSCWQPRASTRHNPIANYGSRNTQHRHTNSSHEPYCKPAQNWQGTHHGIHHERMHHWPRLVCTKFCNTRVADIIKERLPIETTEGKILFNCPLQGILPNSNLRVRSQNRLSVHIPKPPRGHRNTMPTGGIWPRPPRRKTTKRPRHQWTRTPCIAKNPTG